MTTINPWINFNGNAEEAFMFYRSVFGGDFTKVIRLKDVASQESPVSDADAEKIMLIALPIGKGSLLMANDVPASMGKVNENENRSKISVSTDSKERADAIFKDLSAGGQIEVPMSESAWSTYFGMFRDRYGIEWIIEFSSAQ
ncbi:MAG TPA: VOC family protein [Thermodesulfobacteriota bacterium]|nr:VOC family protein [Candidatus Paceibacterota bacterium]HVY55335.1 VOC family protein [Thermodesulfobacteriota bacterium]